MNASDIYSEVSQTKVMALFCTVPARSRGSTPRIRLSVVWCWRWWGSCVWVVCVCARVCVPARSRGSTPRTPPGSAPGPRTPASAAPAPRTCPGAAARGCRSNTGQILVKYWSNIAACSAMARTGCWPATMPRKSRADVFCSQATRRRTKPTPWRGIEGNRGQAHSPKISRIRGC